MIRWLRPGSFRKKSLSPQICKPVPLAVSLAVLFDEGFGSCDAGFEPFNCRQNSGHCG